MRFPAARDVDQRQYQARLDYLAQDTAHLAVPLLRAACDRVARDARGLPYASEIIAAATVIVEERQRATTASAPSSAGPAIGDKAAAYHAANQLALNNGGRVMQADDGELFRLGDPGERRGVRGDGSAIVPFWRGDGEVEGVPQGWYCKQDDAAALSDCYRQHGARFVVRGCMIVERGE